MRPPHATSGIQHSSRHPGPYLCPAQPRVWTPEDFADLGRARQSISPPPAGCFRSLRRIARASTTYPRQPAHRKPTYPNPRDVIDALARKGKVRVVVDGLTAPTTSDSPTPFRRTSACSPTAAAAHHPRQPDPRLPGRRAQPPFIGGSPRHAFRAGAPLAARHASVRRRKPPQSPCLHPQRPRSWTVHSGRLASRPVGAAGVDAGDRSRPPPAGERWGTVASKESEASRRASGSRTFWTRSSSCMVCAGGGISVAS